MPSVPVMIRDSVKLPAEESRRILEKTAKLPSLLFKRLDFQQIKNDSQFICQSGLITQMSFFYLNICPDNVAFYVKSK